MNLPHSLTIQRASEGAKDDRGVPAQTWSDLATVPGWVQPRTAEETAQHSQGGPVVSTHRIYLHPTDLTEADRISYGGDAYQLDGIRDAAGLGHHLEVDARLVEAA